MRDDRKGEKRAGRRVEPAGATPDWIRGSKDRIRRSGWTSWKGVEHEKGKDQAAPPQGPAAGSDLRTGRRRLGHIPWTGSGMGADSNGGGSRGSHMAVRMVIRWREVRKMRKSDFVTGMTAQTRDGNWYLVYDGNLVDYDGYLDLEDYTDDLLDEYNQPEYDIMKVCAPSNMAWTIDDILKNHGEVLWERK